MVVGRRHVIVGGGCYSNNISLDMGTNYKRHFVITQHERTRLHIIICNRIGCEDMHCTHVLFSKKYSFIDK